MSVPVVSAAQANARDQAAIAAGVPSRALMQRAGAGAAAEISRRFGGRLAGGVAVFAGAGNNGGDAWVVGAALAALGVRVRVTEVTAARTDDARAERTSALPFVTLGDPTGAERVVVDGILGTGATGVPRDAAATAIARMQAMRAAGAAVVALDLPSGLDATTGVDDGAVTADVTVTFGTLKRGHLVARGRCGAIVVLDIGLGQHATLDDGAPRLIDASSVFTLLPPIAAEAHKGTRRKLVIVGGGAGMLGAAILAARSAMRSGIGMVRLVVAPGNVDLAQMAASEAMARAWPSNDDETRETILDWADVMLLGPGLGRSDRTRALADRTLRMFRGPVVVDADALNVFEGEPDALGALLNGRAALVTPHPAECARLAGVTPNDIMAGRFEIGRGLARRLHATVLLKGVPTVLTAPDGTSAVSASGNPALAAAGSGDVLAGIAATLLAQMGNAFDAGCCAAWIHGRAADDAVNGRALRGVSLDQVIEGLDAAWRRPTHLPRYPVLAELPSPGEAPA